MYAHPFPPTPNTTPPQTKEHLQKGPRPNLQKINTYKLSSLSFPYTSNYSLYSAVYKLPLREYVDSNVKRK